MKSFVSGIIVVAVIVCISCSAFYLWRFSTTIENLYAERISITDALSEANAYVSVLEMQKVALQDSIEYFEAIGHKPWKSLQELQDWLAIDDISEREYEKGIYDCDDFMVDLLESARLDGRWIGILMHESDDSVHAQNVTIVGNDVWVIEPQSDKLSLLASID